MGSRSSKSCPGGCSEQVLRRWPVSATTPLWEEPVFGSPEDLHELQPPTSSVSSRLGSAGKTLLMGFKKYTCTHIKMEVHLGGWKGTYKSIQTQ